jgi:stress-induced morphogen
VNLRVENEKWHDQAPKGPKAIAEAEDGGEHSVPYAIEVLVTFSPRAHFWIMLTSLSNTGFNGRSRPRRSRLVVDAIAMNVRQYWHCSAQLFETLLRRKGCN